MGLEPDYVHGEPAPQEGTGPGMHDVVLEHLSMRRFMAEQHLAGGITPIFSLAVCDAAAAEMRKRKEFGLKKYGMLLRADNGRNPTADLIEELGDALVYAMQGLRESITQHEANAHESIFAKLLDVYLEAIQVHLVESGVEGDDPNA